MLIVDFENLRPVPGRIEWHHIQRCKSTQKELGTLTDYEVLCI